MKLINVFPCLEKKVKIALKEMNMAQFTNNCVSSIETPDKDPFCPCQMLKSKCSIFYSFSSCKYVGLSDKS